MIDAINAEITRLDEQIGQQLTPIPGTAPACTACGLAGGGHAPGCADLDAVRPGPGRAAGRDHRLGTVNGRALIAELGTDPSQFPTPGHAAGWARLTPRTQPIRGNRPARPHRQGQPVPARRARAGRDDRGPDRYPPRRDVPPDRPQARQAESHHRGLPRHLRDRLDPHLRPLRPLPRTRPGLPPARSAPPARPGRRSTRSSASTPARKSSSPTPARQPDRQAQRNHAITRHAARCHATRRNLATSSASPRSHATEGSWLLPSRWG